MEKRSYGKTGIDLSVIGFGGIMVMDESPDEAARLVALAIDLGINYFDVAPNYGNAQECLGPALERYREDVFLACKTHERSADAARADLERSLSLLRTDHFDLYQLHAVTSDEDVDQILAPGGALETLVAAREEGLVRHLGFSAHTEHAAMRLMDAFSFDSILFPVNWVTWNSGKFGAQAVDEAVKREMAVLALKVLAKRPYSEEETRHRRTWYHPVDSYDEALDAVRFTLSKPVTAAVSPGQEHLLRWAVKAAEEWRPLSDSEEAELATRAGELAPIFST